MTDKPAHGHTAHGIPIFGHNRGKKVHNTPEAKAPSPKDPSNGAPDPKAPSDKAGY